MITYNSNLRILRWRNFDLVDEELSLLKVPALILQAHQLSQEQLLLFVLFGIQIIVLLLFHQLKLCEKQLHSLRVLSLEPRYALNLLIVALKDGQLLILQHILALRKAADTK